MRILAFLLMFTVLYFPVSAEAGTSKILSVFWPPSHWQPEVFQPYAPDAMHQQNVQFRNDGWLPEHWVNEPGGAKAVMDDFFRYGVLVEQDETCEGIPVLEVGEKFLSLSSQEKMRIAEFVNYAYGVTGPKGSGMYYLTYRDDDNVIGVYTKNGLQLH